ncbi:unnamed protein product [Blepharisma stoltei]|uniref:Glutaredoxin domain-containing protein n=1 Tax=Blepharisma stoltei TaxID=1481888 RepID=A0AAU9JEW5_9CILI|nr:unnamed protein product [Blepharisma stoltei]
MNFFKLRRFFGAAKDYSSVISGHSKAHPILLYSRSDSQQSARAKSLLSEHKLSPFVIEIDKEEDPKSFREALKEATNLTRIPIIFVRGKPIGGLGDLRKKLKNGEIQSELKDK